MKNLLAKVDLKKIWMSIFVLFFISVPINLFVDGMTNALLFVGIIILFSYKVEIPKFPIVIFCIALALRVVVVLTVPTPAVSDFEMLLDASQRMIAGDYSYLDKPYFQLWSYQLGFVFFQSLLLRIWNNILILKFMNCLLGAGTVVLVYLISKEFVSKKAAQVVSLIYCGIPFTISYVTILSNQFMSSFLIFLGIYILVSKRIKWHSHIRYLIFAFLLVLANIMRPESVIPLLSAAIFLILTLEKNNIKENLINIAILVVVYFAFSTLADKLFVITGISPNGLTNNDPLWKFVLGFNHETGGSYADADLPYLNNEAAAIELIKSRVFVPLDKLKDLFEHKIKTFWYGSSVGWSFDTFLRSGLTVFGTTFRITDDVKNANAMTSCTMLIMYVLIVLGVVKYIRKKNYNKDILLILNQVFVTFGVYLLIEVQTRYIYHVQICVIILASLGVCEIYNLLKRLKFAKEKLNSENKLGEG